MSNKVPTTLPEKIAIVLGKKIHWLAAICNREHRDGESWSFTYHDTKEEAEKHVAHITRPSDRLVTKVVDWKGGSFTDIEGVKALHQFLYDHETLAEMRAFVARKEKIGAFVEALEKIGTFVEALGDLADVDMDVDIEKKLDEAYAKVMSLIWAGLCVSPHHQISAFCTVFKAELEAIQ